MHSNSTSGNERECVADGSEVPNRERDKIDFPKRNSMRRVRGLLAVPRGTRNLDQKVSLMGLFPLPSPGSGPSLPSTLIAIVTLFRCHTGISQSPWRHPTLIVLLRRRRRHLLSCSHLRTKHWRSCVAQHNLPSGHPRNKTLRMSSNCRRRTRAWDASKKDARCSQSFFDRICQTEVCTVITPRTDSRTHTIRTYYDTYLLLIDGSVVC